MANFPIRNLGTVGVVPDVSPYELPPNAVSRGDNVVFANGKIKRGPVFKSVYQENGQYEYTGASIISQTSSSGTDTFYLCDRRYVVAKWTYPTFSDTSNTTYLDNTLTSTPISTPVCSTSLGDVIYFNKNDRRPIYKTPNENFFRELHPKDSGTSAVGVTSSWGTLTNVWKCESLRAYGDFLIALNMTEQSGEYPSRVRWCDPVTANSPALKWDETDTTSLAGFNDLVSIDGGIVDGLPLGNQFIIYSKDQVWLMDFVGGQFVFNFRKLFSGAGVINLNCVAEVENNHYVFGYDDIYMHNGTQKKSIADNKVRDFIFSGLDTTKNHFNFVHHDVRFKKIYFCYNSIDANVNFDKAEFANKAAVYSYVEGTWSFMDLPNITAAGVGNLSAEISYDEAGSPTYESLGGSYRDASGSFSRQNLFISQRQRVETPASANYPVAASDSYHNLTHDVLLSLDDLDNPMVIATYDAKYNAPAVIERTGIDLDEFRTELRSYKTVSRIYPQMVSSKDADPLQGTVNIKLGAADLPNDSPSYSTATTFLPATDYKVDTRASGRYLSYQVTTSAPDIYFEFTGFDADLLIMAKR